MLSNDKTRCDWSDGSQIYNDYHDNEWGREKHDDNELFEMLILEGFQAGLSWITILKKRQAFYDAFDGFNPNIIALYDEDKVEELVQNEKIIRHRGKINSAINNAQLYLEIQKQYGSFDKFIWSYVDFKPIINHFETHSQIPVNTSLSDKISKDLKKLGFKFVGSTIIYSFMQSIGMTMDHVTNCFVYNELISNK